MKTTKKQLTKKTKTRASKPRARRISQKSVEPGKSVNGELVVVFESNGPLAAEVAKSKLASEGIEAMLKYETAESVFPMTVDSMGEVQVLVRAEDEIQARRILK